MEVNFCAYYQAIVPPKTCHYFVALLRSHEHLCFDRTLDRSDRERQIFEFFVPVSQKQTFEGIMRWFADAGLIQHLQELPNRYQKFIELA